MSLVRRLFYPPVALAIHVVTAKKLHATTFTWCSRLSCVLSSQHFFLLFTSSLIIQCSNGLYLITRPNSTTIRLHNFRDSATLALRLVSPARWYTLHRFFLSLGSALVHSVKVGNVPCFQWAAVSVRGGLALGGPRLQRFFIAAVAGSRAGLVTSAPTFGAIGWLSNTAAGRLALGVILPTFAPVGGLGGLMLQTSRRRRARLVRRRVL